MVKHKITKKKIVKVHLANKKKRKKKQDNKRQRDIDNFKSTIKEHTKKIWLPTALKYDSIENNTWFDIKKAKSKVQNVFEHTFKKMKGKKNIVKCKKVIMHLNDEQKHIIQQWLNAYSLMFNETLRFIKEQYNNKKKISYNFQELRTKYLKDTRNKIIENSGPLEERVKAHILDSAIKQACACYKSCLTNYKQGNIKHFRIRYWRHNRQIKVMDIERSFFTKKGLCFNVLGAIEYTYNGKKYDITEVNAGCKVSYNAVTNQYLLFVPVKFTPTKKAVINKVVALDPGIRTFMTGISENEVIEIANDTSSRIKPYLKRIDRIKSLKVPIKLKRKVETLCYRKITGLVDELHWKTINFLTGHYENILIGDMSVKGIVNNHTSTLHKMTKRVAYSLKFYEFRQRLEYKCQANKLNYILVNEAYTSKTCSNCGNYDNQLGSKKVYDCNGCKTKIGRDINGARGILIKSL